MLPIGLIVQLFTEDLRAKPVVKSRNLIGRSKVVDSMKYRRIANRSRRLVLATLLLIMVFPLRCYSAEIIFIHSAGSASPEQHELELAAQFYGLDLKTVTVSIQQTALALDAIQLDTTVAAAIEADTLAKVDQKALLQALRGGNQGNIPLLILGVTPETDQTLLSGWSGDAAIGARFLTSSTELRYSVGTKLAVTQQLTGLQFPFPGDSSFYFQLENRRNPQVIMSVRTDHQSFPILIETDVQGQKIFLLCRTIDSLNNTAVWEAANSEVAFEKIAPVMVFTKYSAGERGWHAPHHYANLTIDDPWLREPYGNLSYQGLLKEMETHNFHTTIAFIPWNYDRSQPDVASLFRSHPDRFSICIHGDTHAHKEFTDYRSKPLDIQVAALRQSVARMEKFRALSGVPYDRVMIFPHSIAPEKTLEALKANGYLATINSLNVPMDSARPVGLLFALRSATLSFGSFPSIIRYPVAEKTPAYQVAIQEFLDNPLLYYAHQDLFEKGIDAFDGLADEVNKIEPDTSWRSVGDIAKHLYLLRLRADSNYDVLALSSNILLDNTFGHNVVFYVHRAEPAPARITSVSSDGRPLTFELRDGYLDIHVLVPAGETRSVVIQYGNAPDFASISTTKLSLYVFALRYFSDFRDIALSRLRIGQLFITLYYSHRLTAEFVLLGACGLIVLGIAGGWKLLKMRGNSSAERALRGSSPRPGRDGSSMIGHSPK